MIKKIFIILSFFSFFWFTSPIVLAIESKPNPTQGQNDTGGIGSALAAIVNFFKHLILGTNYVSREYEPPSTYNTNKFAHDYESGYHDYSSRAMPESAKAKRKGLYFWEVINTPDKYENKVIEGSTNNTVLGVNSKPNSVECPHDISISDIVCFYSQKYQAGEIYEKILYDHETNLPMDYPEDLNCQPLKNPNDCYFNAYNNYQDVPQGKFFNGSNNTAPIASLQINQSIRTLSPENRHGEDAPDNNDTTDKIKDLVKDSSKQEDISLLNFIKEETHNYIGCDANANINKENLRSNFDCQFTPDKEGKTNCGLNEINTIPEGEKDYECPDEGEKWIRNGHGVSQHGSHGLALSGYNHLQILKKYFGDDIFTTTIPGNDDKNITVILTNGDEDLNGNGVADNDPNCGALVRKGLASEYVKFDLEAKTGAYTDGTLCQFETITKTRTKPDGTTETYYENIVIPNNNPRYKDNINCYPYVTLPVHNYLLGVAEVRTYWEVESQKALTIAFRHEIYGKGSVKDHDGPQVFQCMRVLDSLNPNFNADVNQLGFIQPGITNQEAAVNLTRDEFVFRKYEENMVGVTHLTAFCGPGSSNPNFNGHKYETISRGLVRGGTLNGICFEAINYSASNKDIALSSNKSNLQSYQYNQNPKVLGQTNKSNTCLLDQRLFPSLDQLISSFNSQNPDNQLNFISCYRSTQEQEDLWQQYLSENKGDKFKTISQINYPGTSPHQTGQAIDFGDNFGKLSADSSSYKWLVKNASNFNFYHHPLEPEHWEYKP